MPSFDIVSKVDIQILDNAINSASREISNRYDFKGSDSTIELDKKSFSLKIMTEDEFRLGQIEGILIGQFVKNKLDPKSLDNGKEQYASGNRLRKDIIVKQGIDKETAKKIVKSIKDTKAKVQAAIQDDQIRVTGKKIDDLQGVIAHCRANDFELPLQFINFK